MTDLEIKDNGPYNILNCAEVKNGDSDISIDLTVSPGYAESTYTPQMKSSYINFKRHIIKTMTKEFCQKHHQDDGSSLIINANDKTGEYMFTEKITYSNCQA
ncbi:hypothetical protein VWV82_000124 [Cronobacter malonaticus]|uniref:hypothetical protein n=1 Tax=Cronobacter malonaticus TaxID=413503 RepID=UPI000517C194|nr:hypothetical protein [Cronobacter malonaticus]EMD9271602.1 hypothetical protein [Cronobacter malonaticus]KIU61122.1 hypothetical protein CRSA0334_15770 [Cronobacter malonaticus ENBT0334]MDT3562994.1 hypothetical protein [Cronobacter malonaticus]